jgi:hypothetical protein
MTLIDWILDALAAWIVILCTTPLVWLAFE